MQWSKAHLTSRLQLAVSVLLVLIAITGCNSSPAPAATPESTVAPAATESSEAESSEALSVVAKLQQGEPLVAGVKIDSPPWGFLDDSDKNVGFDVALVEAMAERWGVAIEFVPVTSANRLEKLAAGEVDLVAASMTHRRDREEFNDFSITYFLDGQALLVKEDSGIETVADLDEKAVAAARGTTSIENLRAEADRLGIRVAVVEVDDHPSGLKEVVDGTVDAYTTDASILAGLAKEAEGLVVTGGPFSSEPYGMGLPAGDSQFQDLVNFTLQDLYQDGTYATLYEIWLLGGDPNGINVGGEVFQMELWPLGSATSLNLANFPNEFTPSDAWSRIQETGTLRAGVKVDSPPWGFLDDSDKNVGFDVALVEAMAERWGVAIEFVPVTSANRLEKLAAGEVDLVAASMTHRRDREEFNDFSITYFLDGQALLVKEDSGIETVADLDEKAVAAARGTTSIENLRAEADRLGIRVAVVEVDDHPSGLKEVVDGTVDAYTTDASILAGLAKEAEGLVVTGGPFSSEPYGMGLPAGDSQFQDLVNFTLQDLYQDGTYTKLYETWLLGGDPNGIDVGGQVFQMELWPAGNQANYVLGQ